MKNSTGGNSNSNSNGNPSNSASNCNNSNSISKSNCSSIVKPSAYLIDNYNTLISSFDNVSGMMSDYHEIILKGYISDTSNPNGSNNTNSSTNTANSSNTNIKYKISSNNNSIELFPKIFKEFVELRENFKSIYLNLVESLNV